MKVSAKIVFRCLSIEPEGGGRKFSHTFKQNYWKEESKTEGEKKEKKKCHVKMKF
jgi:hypothetical protein